MSLTPVEIRHVRLPRRPLGYGRSSVDEVLEQVQASFEDVWRERADLRDDVERLEDELARYKELDILLRNSLVAAERTADELRVQAGKEAVVILEEARMRAREVTAGAESERERLCADVRRLRAVEAEVRAGLRAFLLTALDRLERETEDRRAPGQAA